MTDNVLQSFCERCGTRYTFTAPEPEPAAETSRGVLGRFGRRAPETPKQEGPSRPATASPSSEQFEGTFHFCLDCRQYACNRCWNPEAGYCLSCRPPQAAEEPASQAPAKVRPFAPSARSTSEQPLFGGDYSHSRGKGASQLDEWGRPRAEEPAPGPDTPLVFTPPSADADGELDPWRGVVFSSDEGAEGGATNAPPASLGPALPQTPSPTIDFGSDRGVPPEAEAWPVVDRPPQQRSVEAAPGAWPAAGEQVEGAESTTAKAPTEPEVAATSEPEPVVEAVPEPAAAEPEPEVAATPEPEPVVEAVPEPAAAEPEPEVAATPEPEPVVEAVPEPAAAEPEPEVAATPEPEPVVEAVPEPAAAEPEPEVAATPEPEPVVEAVPEPAAAEPEPEVAATPEPEPVVEAVPEPAAAEPEPEVAATPEPEPVVEAVPEPAAADPYEVYRDLTAEPAPEPAVPGSEPEPTALEPEPALAANALAADGSAADAGVRATELDSAMPEPSPQPEPAPPVGGLDPPSSSPAEAHPPLRPLDPPTPVSQPSIEIWATPYGPGPFNQPFEAPTQSRPTPEQLPTPTAPETAAFTATPALPTETPTPGAPGVPPPPLAPPPAVPPPAPAVAPPAYVAPPVAAQPARPTPPLPAAPGTHACPSCGLMLSAKARFCRRCGAPQG